MDRAAWALRRRAGCEAAGDDVSDHLTALSVCRLSYREARVARGEAERIRTELPERAARLLARATDRLQRGRAWRAHLAKLGITDREVEDLEAESRR